MPDADLDAFVTRLRSVKTDLTHYRDHKVVDDDAKWYAITNQIHALEAIANHLAELSQR